MIKVFTLNKNNKIELTKEQLESLLNEAYFEGKGYTWTYKSPSSITSPYWTYTTTATNDGITLTTTNDSNLTCVNTGTTIKADDIKYRS